MLQKPKRWKSNRYLKYVRSLPCCVCGGEADHAHHLIGIGGMGGMGIKSPDYTAVPLCAVHHSEVHNDPKDWEEQWRWMARTMGQAIEEKVI